jgi:hypothetical protein
MAEKEPILIHDGKEHWLVYPEDNAYLMCNKVKPDEDGVRHVTQEMVEALKGWWYTLAIEKVEQALTALNIPFEELRVTEEDIESGDLMRLSKKLAISSHYIIKVNEMLTLVEARNSAAKDALDHASNQRVGRDERYKGEGRQPAIAVRIAMAIHEEKPLRNAKIDVIETAAFLKALEHTKNSLDILWRTASRIISARLKEPID